MGAYNSVPSRPPQSLVLLYSDTQVQSIVGRRLRKESPNISDGRLMNDGTFEFPLKFPTNSGNLKCAQIFCRLLADLNTHGWKLAASSDLCRVNPRSTLFFRRYQRDLTDAASSMIGILAGSSDVIRLVDVPDQLSASLTTALENLPEIGPNVRVVGQEIGAGHAGESIEGRIRRFIEMVPAENGDQRSLLTKVLLKTFSHLHENRYDFYGVVNTEGGADLLLFEKASGIAQRPRQHFFAVDLINGNILRSINGTDRLYRVVVNCVSQHWPHGMITSQVAEPGMQTYVLNGQPWAAGTTTLPDDSIRKGDGQVEEALKARRFVSALIELLTDSGCRLIATPNLDRVNCGTSTFVFSQPSTVVNVETPTSRVHRNAWCMSPMSISTIFLVNAFFLHRGSFHRLKDELRSLLQNRWPRGLKLGNEEFGFRHYVLSGYPWQANPDHQPTLARFRRPPDDHGPNEDLHARGLICAILAVMEIRGHQLVCTASVSSKRDCNEQGVPQCKSDCDTWFWVETEGGNRRLATRASDSLTRSLLGLPTEQTRPSAPALANSSSTPTVPVHQPSAPTTPQVIEANPPPYPVEAPPPPYRDVALNGFRASWRY